MSIMDGPYSERGALNALNPNLFNLMIASMGWRLSWMKSHSCPCTFGGGGADGFLPLPGSAAAGCKTCLGLGTYWDPPTVPFIAFVKFVEMSPTPDEPGVRMHETYGLTQLAEPSLTIPYTNPFLSPTDPQQSTEAWHDMSTDDIIVAPDMLARFTAKLQVGGIEYLPYQQNLQIKPQGAVTVWNPTTLLVEHVAHYSVDGAKISLGDVYPPGTAYMVEFQAATMFVAFRPAGGIPHVRQMSANTANLPRRFKLQQLDLWLRERGQGPVAPGSTAITGTAFPQIFATGRIR